MINPPEYLYLANFIISKRKLIDGFEGDVVFDMRELDSDQVEDKSKLIKMLSKIKNTDLRSKEGLRSGGSKITGIDDYEIDEEGKVTIIGSTIDKLDLFHEKVALNGVIIKKDNTEMKPTKLPKGLSWGNIIIKFLDGHDVKIIITSTEYTNTINASYRSMGFKDGKTSRPNKQWELLQELAVSSGEISWESRGANRKITKRKSVCAKSLKEYFQLDSDPFHPYKENNSYKAKFKIVPENSTIPDIDNEEVDPLGINESYNAQTSSL